MGGRVLVNEHSASASEMVAAFAAENGLARIVGTNTPGRLVGSKPFKLSHGYFLILPIGAYVTWQGKRLEGEGVRPIPTCHCSMRLFRGAATINSSRNCGCRKSVGRFTLLRSARARMVRQSGGRYQFEGIASPPRDSLQHFCETSKNEPAKVILLHLW